jgi:hypothetical protein
MSDYRRKDLLGHPLPARDLLRRDGSPRKLGYASPPGTGPKGQRCNTCKFCMVVVEHGRRARKCEIVAAKWTTSPETDIKHNAPACRDWSRKSYREASK